MKYIIPFLLLYFIYVPCCAQNKLEALQDSLATIDNNDATTTQILNNSKPDSTFTQNINTDTIKGIALDNNNFIEKISGDQNNVENAGNFAGIQLIVGTAISNNVAIDTAILINNGINPLMDIEGQMTEQPKKIKEDEEEKIEDIMYCPGLYNKIKDLPDLCDQNRVEKVITMSSTSVVAIFSIDDLEEVNGQYIVSNYHTLGQRMGLCQSEQFTNQPSIAIGTGFLIDSTRIVTALHNIQYHDVHNLRFVVGYELYKSSRTTQLIFKKEEVYKLDSVEYLSYQHDFVVIKSKNPIFNRIPANLNTFPINYSKVTLFTLGYPLGLPMKATKSGKVKTVSSDYLTCTLDCYVGNSGSPVFNSYTGLVIGILLGGEIDLIKNGNCYETKKCGSSKCSNEMILPISIVISELKVAGIMPP